MSHWATRLRLVAGIVGLSLFAAAGQLHALSGGPTVPRSGAPGESNCASCHHGAENANGSVAVSFSGGNTYTPGVWKRVTITITPNPTTSAQVKYGFQASARAGGSRAGTFGIINDNSQFMAVKCAANASASLTDRPAGGSCGATGYEYIQHNQPYGGGGGLATYTVSFLWQPPASNVGNVTFYATSVLGVSPYPTPTYAFGTSKTLTFQGPGTAPDPVYPAGSLGLEALDTASNQIVATRIVTANPLWKTAMKRDGSRVYALTLRGNQLLTIDPRNGALLNTISVLGTALALSPDESRLYVVGQLNVSTARLYVFDAGTGAPIGSPLDFASAAYYFAVAATPDGRRIYIVPWLSSPTVVVIDAATRTQLASITTSALPRALAVSPDSSRLLVATVDDTTSASALTIFSTATGAALAPPIQLDPVARGVVFSPDGASAYVLTEDGTNFVRITTIDVATANPVAQFSFPSLGNSNFFRISPDGAYFYGGGNVNPGGEPNVYGWSVALAGTPMAIPSAQGVLDIAVRPPPPLNLQPTVTTIGGDQHHDDGGDAQRDGEPEWDNHHGGVQLWADDRVRQHRGCVAPARIGRNASVGERGRRGFDVRYGLSLPARGDECAGYVQRCGSNVHNRHVLRRVLRRRGGACVARGMDHEHAIRQHECLGNQRADAGLGAQSCIRERPGHDQRQCADQPDDCDTGRCVASDVPAPLQCGERIRWRRAGDCHRWGHLSGHHRSGRELRRRRLHGIADWHKPHCWASGVDRKFRYLRHDDGYPARQCGRAQRGAALAHDIRCQRSRFGLVRGHHRPC
jgi:YVTN family beta-propeller protein